MRRLLVSLFITASLSGCASTKTTKAYPAVAGVLPPPTAQPVDIAPVFQRVSNVKDSVDRAYESVRILEGRINHATEEAAKAQEGAQQAFTSGLQAGGEAAKILKDHVGMVGAELAATKEERDRLGAEVLGTRKELSAVGVEVGKVQLALTKLEYEAVSLRASLTEANQRIESSSQLVATLQAGIAKSEEQITSKTRWVWRWAGAFFALLTINGVYVAGKVNGWGLISRF